MSIEHEELTHAIAEPVAEVLADVIEAQEERADVAEIIAEAALEGARGEHLNTLERDLEQCRTNLAELRETLETLPVALAEQTHLMMEALELRLSALEAARPANETPVEMPPSILTPPVSETMEAPETIPVETEGPAVVESPSPAPRRFRSI